MFTGLIADIGTVERVVPQTGGVRLTLRPHALDVDALALGESIACAGCCQTVAARGGGLVSFDAVPETLSRTTLGSWRPGVRVNLERALALGDRVGGHLVAGHVDAVGRVLARVPEGQGFRFTFSLPASLAPLVAEKGSIAVEGVSVTVARALRDRFEVALIPETLARTTLTGLSPGALINLEADLIARYVARFFERGAEASAAPAAALDMKALAGWGYDGSAA